MVCRWARPFAGRHGAGDR